MKTIILGGEEFRNTLIPPASPFDPRLRHEWTNGMDADDEDSGIELVTVNNYQQRNINQLVSGFMLHVKNLNCFYQMCNFNSLLHYY